MIPKKLEKTMYNHMKVFLLQQVPVDNLLTSSPRLVKTSY